MYTNNAFHYTKLQLQACLHFLQFARICATEFEQLKLKAVLLKFISSLTLT